LPPQPLLTANPRILGSLAGGDGATPGELIHPELSGVIQQPLGTFVEGCLSGGVEPGAGPGHHVDMATRDLPVGQRAANP
jgi:hypothetical protein